MPNKGADSPNDEDAHKERDFTRVVTDDGHLDDANADQHDADCGEDSFCVHRMPSIDTGLT